jgi:hypothetical protein
VIIEYPAPQAHRRHGPAGYTAVSSFRPWLRDEFDFRCVYCLKREQWGQVTFEFDIDHFLPQSVMPVAALEYANLVYACHRCNGVKGVQTIDDPWWCLRSNRVVVTRDGDLRALDAGAQRTVLKLDLNSPRLKAWRALWMRIIELARLQEPELYSRLIAFPEDLPNLSLLNPSTNTRPEGLLEGWYARRERGELPPSD